ncbi:MULTISPECIES: glycosyltransferase [Lactobacillaceae]|uniref:glycosyltransferase n=1 Tax=Lactobacillaceae TaxID=33958 RepID=UPI000E08FAB6|nr:MULTISPECIES: glycosyltransferase [Lactobacillaceae]MCT3276696.1 multidrug MFS transporter [Lactiplantibacillus pentosus]MDT8952611.1 glycosyltransferase [Lacticaseibacillus paracasei subsp. paracasei]RDF80848.1 multidrug MFS transporter [Lacticaseibacillus paracasei]
MIFVTVGTHEQPFNRLIGAIDELVEDGRITEDVVVQYGYSTYKAPHCKSWQFIPYQQMWNLVKEARIVITHGGPSSFIMSLQMGKIPIVVPRQAKFDEHVNDHQLIFAKEVARRKRNIVVLEDINKLADTISSYDEICQTLNGKLESNNIQFNHKFAKIVDELLTKN